jgi:glycosyltransferase involved in cell wall biosynthesis
VILFLPILLCISFIARFRNPNRDKPKIVFGCDPLLNNKYWSAALREHGYDSVSISADLFYFSNIEDFDIVLISKLENLPLLLRRVIQYLRVFSTLVKSIYTYEVFVISCNGYLLHFLPFLKHGYRLEFILLKIAKKKIVVIPFGADSSIGNRIRSIELAHVLQWNYPSFTRNQIKISKRVDFWTEHADIFIPGCMTPDGFGRWDVLTPSILCIDTSVWQPTDRLSISNGLDSEITISHAPNHQGIKGTEFIQDAVARLKEEGFRIKFNLLTNLPNDQIRHRISFESDIHIDQIVASAYALNAIESMSLGITTILGLENIQYTQLQRRYSFLDQCPGVSSSPERIYEDLKFLIQNPELRQRLGRLGPKYVEKFHSYKSFAELFAALVTKMYRSNETLLNFYHPLNEINSRGKLEVPLFKNRLKD